LYSRFLHNTLSMRIERDKQRDKLGGGKLVSFNPPDDQIKVTPLAFVRAFRYLKHDARKDFQDALMIGRNLRDRKISRKEFSAAMDQRFPPPESVPR